MELLEGATLREALRQDRFAPSRALAVMRGVCAAMDAGHRRHLLHRDLKPENIILVKQGDGETAKVLDFGVAKTLNEARDTVSEAGRLVGTLRYMAPAQLRGEDGDSSSDVWALGVIAYEMLTGAHPFEHVAIGRQQDATDYRRHDRAAARRRAASWRGFFRRALAIDSSHRPPRRRCFSRSSNMRWPDGGVTLMATLCDDPLEPGARCRYGAGRARARGAGDVVWPLLVSALFLPEAPRPQRRRRAGSDAGLLRAAAREARAARRRSGARPFPLVPAGVARPLCLERAGSRPCPEARQRRAPISLDVAMAEDRYVREPADPLTPEHIFNRNWALAVLERVLMRLRDGAGRCRQRQLFEGLKGYLTGEEAAGSYQQVGLALGMTEGALKVAVHRLRRRYRTLLYDEIAQTVATPEEIDLELQYLIEAIKK